MFIQTESTPNPQTLKFLPGRAVMPQGTVDFPDKESGRLSPLAARLFSIPEVERVFFGSDFITVTKRDAKDVDWGTVVAIIDAAGGARINKVHFKGPTPAGAAGR